MISEETKKEFKIYLEKFTKFFQNEFNPEGVADLKDEINDKFTKDDVIECWTLLFKVQGPIEKASRNKYEIYDVSNFMGEISGSSDDYIHTVNFTDEESTSAIFMKFYFVFYCLINGIKSNEYKITEASSGSV